MVGLGMGQSLEKNLRKIESFREKGQLDRALKQLQDWARKHPDTPHYQFEAAMVAFDLGDWGTGVTALRGLVRGLPETREKVLGACRERFESNAALALGEFLIEQALADGEVGSALDLLYALADDDRAIYRRKHVMRHQSLIATGGSPDAAVLTSHCLQFLLGCADGDGDSTATEAAALAARADANYTDLESLVARAIDARGEVPGFVMARAHLRMAAGGVAEACAMAVRAAQLDTRHLDDAGSLAKAKDPADDTRGRWLLSRGDLAVLSKNGDEAARLYLESADADPSLRDQLLERLARASQDTTIPARGELLKLQLRLLVVQKRFDEIPPLSQQLLRDGHATAQEMRGLLGEGRSDGLPNEMLVVMAETALRDGDLPAAAVHAHEIPASDHTALNRLLRSVEDLLTDWQSDDRVQLEALHAVLLARVKNHESANERLTSMWRDYPEHDDMLLAVTEKCLESIDPRPQLAAAALGVLIDAGKEDLFAPTVARMLRAGADHDSGASSSIFDQENLSLDFQSSGEDVSSDLGSALVHVLEQDAARAPRLLALLDALDPSLGVNHRLRHAMALAALWSRDYARALPELSVVVMMAEDSFIERVGAQIDRAIEADPGQPDLHMTRAEFFADVGDVENASEQLSLALNADPSRADDLTARFETLIGKAAPDEAPALWHRFAESLFAAGRFDQLAEVCRRALESLPPDRTGPFLELQARTMLEEGRLSDALQFVQKHMVAGRISNDQALQILEDTLRAHPASSIGHLMLGQAATRANDMDRAIDGYLGAVRLDESLAGPVGEQIHKIASRPGTQGKHLVRVSQFQLERGDHASAAALLDKALRMDPGLADRVLGEVREIVDATDGPTDVLVVGAHAARLSGDVERACEILLRLDARDPGRFEIVLAEYRKLREDFPDRLLPVLCMARVLLHHDAAEAAAQTVVDASTDESYALDDRVEMLHEFHGRQPKIASMALALAARLGEQGNFDAAVDRLKAAIELHDLDIDEGVEVARATLALEPEHPQLRLQLHDLLVRAGSVDEALRVLPDPIALAEIQQQEITERMGAYRARVIASPELASVFARSLQRQGRQDEALEVLWAASERTGARSEHPIWTELAAALHAAGEREASGRILLEQAKDEEARRQAHHLYGEWSTSRVESELNALAERHRARPNAAHLAFQYAALLLEADRPEDVPGILAPAAVNDEWKVQRAVLLGRAFLDLNQVDRAEAVLQDAACQAGASDQGPDLLVLLSECHERLGRPAAATARLSQLLDDDANHVSASRRVRRTYGQYIEDVAGTRRAVLTRVSSL